MDDGPQVRRRLRVTLTRGDGTPQLPGEVVHYVCLGGVACTGMEAGSAGSAPREARGVVGDAEAEPRHEGAP